MIRYATTQDAQNAVELWSGDPQSLAHIGHHATSVFSFRNTKGEIQILRLSDPTFRSLPETIAELNFVDHLFTDKVPVASPISTVQGELAVELSGQSGLFICSSVTYAAGLDVNETSSHWNKRFFEAWGRNLALIHESSARFKPSDDPYRWKWKDEILFRQAEKLIPPDDTESREEIKELFHLCEHLNTSAEEFGLIHADHAAQNFRYDADKNCVTVFDFGNCCYHWFIADLAISLSTVRRKTNRNLIKQSILAGYSSVRSLPAEHDRLINLFIRLRVVYFYLSRLYMWATPTFEQKQDLLHFRKSVHSKMGWDVD